jgi:hypothetical protein
VVTLEIVSPHDAEARFSHKPGKIEWIGYKDHQTETCDNDRPRVIVHVVTTPAPQQDIDVLGRIHDDLAHQSLEPNEHLLDSGTSHQKSSAMRQRDTPSPLSAPSGWTRPPPNAKGSPRKTSTSTGRTRR